MSHLQERLDTRDPRRSMEERYPTKDSYVAAVRNAADDLVSARLLLPDDARLLVGKAESEGIRLSP